ncbi:MAG: Spy/CpxP family protein refolding chaperone [Syntrophotaleaceae bacterium]
MKKQVMLMVLCGTLLLGTGWVAMAAPGPWGMGDGPMRGKGMACQKKGPQDHWARLLEKLDLSPEQQAEVQKLTEANRERAQGLHAQMVELRRQMRQVMQPKAFNEKALRKLAADKAKIQTELMVGRASTHSKIYALLTPEQQELADLDCKLRRLQGKGPRSDWGNGPQGDRSCPNPGGPENPQRWE